MSTRYRSGGVWGAWYLSAFGLCSRYSIIRVSAVNLVCILLVSCLPGLLLVSPHWVMLRFQNDCVEVAKSLRFNIRDEGGLLRIERVRWNFAGLGPYVTGDPIVERLADDYRVTFELRDMPAGEAVSIPLVYGAPAGLPIELSVRNAAFYSVPPVLIGELPPPCPPPSGPGVSVVSDPSVGLLLRVFNSGEPTQGALAFTALQWAVSNEEFPPDQLDWGSTQVEALPWSNLATTVPLVLNPGDPGLFFDVPDELVANSRAVFFRYIATSPSVTMGRGVSVASTEQRVVWEALVETAIPATPTSWGQFKAKYLEAPRP